MAGPPNDANPVIRPPRRAAAAGIVFSALMIASLAIIRMAIPADPAAPGIWLADAGYRRAVRLALNVVPFAGIAFLWFMGVVRNLARHVEDQFFATLLLASGLLFVASVFFASVAAGALLDVAPAHIQGDETYDFARQASYASMNVFGIKMAGVFIFSTCAIGLRTAIFPRWIAVAGFVCGIVLLLVISSWLWIAVLFPLWVMLLSTWILLAGPDQARRGLPLESGQ